MSRITIINPIEERGWDSMVLAHANCGFFHSRAWATVMASTYRYGPCYLVCREAGTESVFPLMDASSPLTGRRGVCLPFADHCAPLVPSSPAGLPAIVEEALRLAAKRRWNYIEVHGKLDDHLFRPCRTYLEQEISLDADLAKVQARFRESTWRNVQKAQRLGVHVHASTGLNAVRLFHRMHAVTRKRLGVPVQPRLFFDNLHAHAIGRGFGFVVLASYRGETIAGAVFLHFGHAALYKFGAAQQHYQSLRPGNLVMWEAIRRCHAMGFTSVSLGRTDADNTGLLQYKGGWGCAPRVLQYVRWQPRGTVHQDSVARASGLVRPVLRRLPTPVLRVLGRALYSHIG